MLIDGGRSAWNFVTTVDGLGFCEGGASGGEKEERSARARAKGWALRAQRGGRCARTRSGVGVTHRVVYSDQTTEHTGEHLDENLPTVEGRRGRRLFVCGGHRAQINRYIGIALTLPLTR